MHPAILRDVAALPLHIEHSDFHDQLVRGLAHKLNNILGLFNGYLGLMLEDQKLTPETLEGLNRIRASAMAAGDLIDRTKTLARPATAVWREVDTGQFIGSVRPSLQQFVPDGIELVIEAAPDLPTVWADATRLRMALVELVKNATDATSRGGTVMVSAFTETAAPESTDRWVVFAVTDHGDGVAPEIEPRIFQPFFSTKSKGHTDGLGLPVALGLVQQMNGVLRFSSEPGTTVFRIMLPESVRSTA